MANKPEEFPIFTKLDTEQIRLLSQKLHLYINDFENDCGINNVIKDGDILVEIFDRIEKRRVYFHIFHNIKMGELNEGSLMCFWVLKLMPFSHPIISANDFNAKIALYVFYQMLIYVAKKKDKNVNLEPSLNKELYYSFRFRDLSKEAIMAIAESMIY